MRKFVSVLLVAVMVLSLSAVAFAAPEGNSVSLDAKEANPTVEKAVDASGKEVELEVTKPELAPGETVESVAEDALKAAEKEAGVTAEEITAAEVFDIQMSDGSDPTSAVTVTIVRETKTGEVAAVMYQAADGTWDSAKFTDNGDGTVTIVFEHFCTVVLLVKEPTVVTPEKKPSTSSNAPTSPKTGYD